MIYKSRRILRAIFHPIKDETLCDRWSDIVPLHGPRVQPLPLSLPDRCRGRTTVHSSFFQLIWVLKPSGTSGWRRDGVVVMVIGAGGVRGGGLQTFPAAQSLQKVKGSHWKELINILNAYICIY